MKVSANGHSGSGTVIGIGENVKGNGKLGAVITCRHVAPKAGTYKLHFPKTGKVIDAQWLCASRADGGSNAPDLALLVFSADDTTPCLKVAENEPAKGEDIWQVGYPQGRGPRDQHGKYSGSQGRSVGATIRAIPGDSGSGMFNAKGELVGVLWGWESNHGTALTGLKDIQIFMDSEACHPWGKIINWIRRKPGSPSQPPQGGGGGPGKPMPPDAGVPRPAPPEELPQPKPQPPAASIPPDFQRAIDGILIELKAQREMIAAMKPIPGPPGPPGKDGRDGKDGINGTSPTAAKPTRVRVVPAGQN